MKGLLLKDFYMIMKSCRIYLFLIAVFIVVSFWGNDNIFFIAYPCMLAGMLPITLLAFDESCRWNIYSGTLPYSKAQIVSEKYLIGLIVQLIVVAFTGVAQAARMSNGDTVDFISFLVHYLLVMSIFLILACVPSALCLPLVFKWGVEKGRIAYYVGIGTIMAVFAAGSILLKNDIQPTTTSIVVLPLLCLGGIALYALSWWLSIVFYKKREV